MSEIVWLASYPRSGNTLLRVILNDCFDMVAGSKYDESNAYGPLQKLIGLERATRSPIVKTHDHPESADPAIFIVRDGRASIVSYWHYLNEYSASKSFWKSLRRNTRKSLWRSRSTPLNKIIKGDVAFGSWSDHFRAWSPEVRPNTLLLRFEDYSADPEAAIEALAAFLNIRPKRAFSKTFAELRMADRKFFRCGDNDGNLRELRGNDLALFDSLHGPLMRHLAYR
jgi:hypothetical protein